MKTVLHLIDTSGPGGAETIFMNLLEAFNQGQFRSIPLVTPGSWAEAKLTERGIKANVCHAKGSFASGYLLEIVRLVRRERIDLIQAHLPGANVYASIAGVLTRTPVVSIFHGSVDMAEHERLRWAKVGAINTGSRRIVAVSNHLKADLLERTSLSAKKMQVIHNGVDIARFTPSKMNLLRRELSLSPESFIVCSLGNVRPAKGYDHLIEAAGQVVREAPHIHFVIAGQGKGQLLARLQEMRRRRQLQGNVHFLGFREDAVSILSSSDVFLLPSTSEGFSISTIEAMACGLPVVATRSGGPEEIVTSGVDGQLIPATSSTSIAETILELARDAALRKRLGRAASVTAAKKFSLEAMLQEYERLYGELLNFPRSGPVML